MGQPSLGFEKGLVPDGAWLYKVARFVDRCNVCGLFEKALEEVPTTDVNSYKVELAKRAAEKDVIISTGVDKAKGVQIALQQLVESQKRLVSRKAELDNITIYGHLLEKNVEEDKSEVNRRLTNVVLQIYAEGKKVAIEEALNTDDPKKKELFDM